MLEYETYDAIQARRLQRFLTALGLFAILFTLAACLIGALVSQSWYALAVLSGLPVQAVVFWRARPMGEGTYRRKLRRQQKEGEGGAG